jgi:hypothetical protein
MLTATLGSMRSEAATLVNLPEPTASTRVTISIANQWVNRGLRELFLIALNAAGETVYRKTWRLDTTGSAPGTFAWPLPLDFYSLKSVAYLLDATGSDRVTLDRFTLAERPWLMSATPGWQGQPFRYDLAGKGASDGTDPGSIELLPVPSAGWCSRSSTCSRRRRSCRTRDDRRLRRLRRLRGRLFRAPHGDDDGAAGARRRVGRGARAAQGERPGEHAQRDAAQAPRVNMTRDPWTPRALRGGRRAW